MAIIGTTIFSHILNHYSTYWFNYILKIQQVSVNKDLKRLINYTMLIYLLSYFKPLHMATDESYSHFIFCKCFQIKFFFSFFQIRLVYFRTCMAVIRESNEWAVEFRCFGFVGPMFIRFRFGNEYVFILYLFLMIVT